MKKVIILLSFIVLTAFSGCGQGAGQPSLSETQEVVDWKTEGFAAPEELKVEQVLWAGQYLPWEHESGTSADGVGELSYLDSGVCGEVFWYFGVEPIADGESALEPDRKYVLEIYDTIRGESIYKSFSPEELGLEAPGLFDSMDMMDREHFVLRWAGYGQNEEGMYHQTADCMVYTDLAGELQTADFRKTYLDKGLIGEQFTELPLLKVLDWGCDSKGNIYVTDPANDSTRFYLLDKSGELLLEHKVTGDSGLVALLRTPEGELILPVYEENSYAFLWVDTEGRELRPLVRIETTKPYIDQMYGMLGNDIYYRSSEGTDTGIVRWNIKSGSKVQVLSLRTAGISTGDQTMLALREGQTPYLRLTKYSRQKPEEWLTELTGQKPAEKEDVRVADLTGSGELVEKCAAQTSMEKPGVSYRYENASAQEARDRIMAELSQGKGPDFLFVSMEDMYVLEEKGLLMDIGELLPQELKEELLPGALELGTVDGRLYGLPAAIKAKTLVVSGETWSRDTWQLEDIIGLMEEGKLTGALRSPLVMSGDYLTPSLTVVNLTGDSLGDSFLIDWENRSSHFDDERFIRLLELTATDRSKVSSETEEWLDGGKSIMWGYFTSASDFLDFFAHMEKEGGRITGYPTEGSCGSYLVPDGGVLVVNVNTARKDTVTDFLEILLGRELQLKNGTMGMSVRRLSPEDYIVEKEDGRLLFMGNARYEVPVFRDGTTALDRAKVFLESCVAEPPAYARIISIISEELNAMYTEKKSPGITAETINRRVQLYLDEGN